MALSSGRTRGRALSRLVTAAIAATLVGTTAGTAMADSPASGSSAARDAARDAARGLSKIATAPAQAAPAQKDGAKSPARGLAAHRAVVAPSAKAPVMPLGAVNASGELYFYGPDGKGGLTSKELVDTGWDGLRAAAHVDHDRNGVADGTYVLSKAEEVWFSDGGAGKRVADDWGQYDSFFSPGDLGGSKQSDILVRDRDGVLFLYTANADGSLPGRKKVGPGWGQFTEITGRGDLTGDGRTDIVARDRDGVLWLYKGTGDATKPFEARTKIGPGWNQFNELVATGDVDLDGRADLIARNSDGSLWLYKGTGNASAPFKSREKIGNSGWNQYSWMF
ncbi:FG-GAP repeat domain-containing protein [Streptomyces sp. NPDC053048]|uniref:FG-GAP repeat domain-containing protein n=1 Tax=Streptomyces sp. NPDC053048 TaxID=3365694 RepID=UPI0037CF01F5